MSKQNFFVGKTITGIKIASDREALLISTTDGDVVVPVDADCCSQTWIESVELPALGFPALVTAVENLDMDPYSTIDGWDEPSSNHKPSKHHVGGEVIAYYGCKISTDHGDIVIDYRNDSNGYYGGKLVWPGDFFYGGVFSQNVSSQKWQDL